jgi:transposase InsO family protein
VWLTRLKNHVKNHHSKDDCDCVRGKPTSAELEKAEYDIVRVIQESEYPTEFETLRSGKNKVKASSNIAKLNPFIGQNDLLRIGSRLEHAPLSYDAKFPPILPKHHQVVELMARHVHNNNAHIGQEHTLSLLRQKWWICQACSLVRRIINKCFTCRKGHATLLHQQMASLPPYRVVAYEPPFTYVGADMFGPILVKQGRSTIKRWGCIFTCMCTRAIHLEVAPSLETDDFINVLRLFIARRGTPREIRTDCGTNFRGADNELRHAITKWNEADFQEKLSQRGITWIFNPPHAPHFAGVWERLIKDVKRALKAILKGSLVTNHVLQTVFAEVESILNSRPLTKSSEDASDATAISPAHLLLQKPAVVLPPGEFNNESNITRKKWRQVQVLARHFCNRWIKEYLTTLHLRQKWLNPQRNVQVCDVVLVGDKKIGRGQWPLAIITKVFPGRDNKIRTVELKTKDSVIVRPVVDVCLLEECST